MRTPNYDIIGQRFGKLTVIKLSNIRKNNRTTWKCLCDCGNTTYLTTSILKSGHTTSCGCLKNKPRYIDLTNQKFGRLTVIKYIDNDSGGNATYLCQCDCGNLSKVTRPHLIQNHTRSCGCLSIELNIKRMRIITQSLTGSNHHNWNPDLTDEERQIQRKFSEYRSWRKQIYERDNYICQICRQRGGRLIAHHLASYASNKDLRIDLDNGITLCRKCHIIFHKKYGYKNNTKEQFKEFLDGMELQNT